MACAVRKNAKLFPEIRKVFFRADYIGFYHGLSFGRESLASDLIEPFRPLVDRFSIGLFSAGHLRKENFSTSAQGCLLGKAGRVKFYALYEEAAEDFRKRTTQSVSDMVTLLRKSAGYVEAEAGDPQEQDGHDGDDMPVEEDV